VVAHDRDRELWQAFQRLPDRCQTLLRLLVVEQGHSYATVASAMAMPVGALGPTRGRCLTTLRDELHRVTTEKGIGT
jgi:DNA-directed RNA polymerase specialized sigma24 family protein